MAGVGESGSEALLVAMPWTLPWLEGLHRFLWGLTADWITLVGLFLSLGLQFLPLRQLPQACLLYGRMVRQRQAGSAEISSFAAHMTSLGGVLGVGHLTGMAAGLSVGGPGIVPWMWLIGLIGMATQYAETFLAVHDRSPGPRGVMIGGPVEVIRRSLGHRWRGLAVLMAALGSLGVFGAGNGVQAQQVTVGLEQLTGLPPALLGLLVAALLGWLLLGGLPRLSRLLAVLVPLMLLVYLTFAVGLLAPQGPAVVEALRRMLLEAFSPGALAAGSLVGLVRTAVLMSVFATETGLGTTAIAHAAAAPAEPRRQASLATVGNLISLLVCTATALLLQIGAGSAAVSGGHDPISDSGALALLEGAVTRLAPGSDWVLSLCLVCFAFSTLLSFGYYGERFFTALVGERGRLPFLLLWLLATLLASTRLLPRVWGVSQVLDALMVLPNLLLLLLLSGFVFHAAVGRAPLTFNSRRGERHP